MQTSTPSFDSLLDQIAAKTPTPGGGYVAAAVGALATALGSMVLSYSLHKKSLSQHASSNQDALEQLDRARALLMQLAREDALAYEKLNTLQKMPESAQDASALLEAARLATLAPLSSASACADTLRVLEPLTQTTNHWLVSDLAIAAILADAAARACVWNVRINLPTLTALGESTDRIDAIKTQTDELLASTHQRATHIEHACSD